MGPMAWYEAGKVKGLNIKDKEKGLVIIDQNTDGNLVVDNLVDRFGQLFGRAGREVCKEAVGSLIAELKPSQIPNTLK